MRKKLVKAVKSEEGGIILLFAGILVILIFFVGLSLDMGMLYLKRNNMQNLCQLIREDRFTYQDTIRYADNPGLATYQVAARSLESNDFNGQVKIYFCEDTPQFNYRSYRVRTELSEDFSFAFLQILGLSSIKLTVHLDGGETYGEGGDDVIWYPPEPVSSYNGSYTGEPGGGYTYDRSDLPDDWQ